MTNLIQPPCVLFQEGGEVIQLISEDRYGVPDSNRTASFFKGLRVFSSDGYFEATRHWGCDVNHTHNVTYTYRLCEYRPRPVIHSLAMYGPSRTGRGTRGTTQCDPGTPSVAVGEDTYSLLRLEQGLFYKPAFWAIPGFKISSDRERIVWDFLVQKVLHHSKHSIVLHAGSPFGHTSEYERRDTLDLVQHFRSAKISTEGSTTAEIIENLLSGMREDALRVKAAAWLGALSGLQQRSMEKPSSSCLNDMVMYKPVNHLARHQVSKGSNTTGRKQTANLEMIHTLHDTVCKDYVNKTEGQIDFQTPWIQFKNILLLVVFNNPLYASIPYVEVLYRPFFKRILYCGPKVPKATHHQSLAAYNISFISYGDTPKGHSKGALNYRCVQLAAEMRYTVEGIVVMADDVLLMIHDLKSLDADKIWYWPNNRIRTADIIRRKQCVRRKWDMTPNWPRWYKYWSAAAAMFRTLEEKQNISSLARRCYSNLVEVNGAKLRINGAWSDFYYVPNSLVEDFAELAKIFAGHKVFLEIAVATIIQCLALPSERESMNSIYLWFRNRNRLPKYFNQLQGTRKGFIHPVKWSQLNRKSPMHVNLFCNALMFMHDSKRKVRRI